MLRRPALLLAGALVGFAVVLSGLLVLVPREPSVRVRTLPPPEADRPDTLPLLAAIAGARGALGAAESLLTEARATAERPVAPAPRDTLPPAAIARRDTLRAQVALLGQLLQRAELAPLPASFRALGESPRLRGNPQVRTLLDSLSAIERERDAFGVIGGVDPIYVALTSRAMALGKEIEAIAERQHAEMRREIVALRPPPPPVVERATVDTMPLVARRDSAVAELTRSLQEFQHARSRLAEHVRRERETRMLANISAPPAAVILAALVLGVVLGFAAAFGREAWRPRVADPGEVERVTGTRVLATVGTRQAAPERSRRRADWDAPPLINPADEGYRLLHHHLAGATPAVPLVAVTGEEPGITAAVAVNLAVMSANEARSTLLVDADLETGAVAAVMRVRAEPGVRDAIEGGADWAEVVVPATVGRDRTVFVIPAGRGRSGGRGGRGGRPPIDEEASVRLRSGLERMARRYDFVVATAPPARGRDGPVELPAGPDVIRCARVGHTSLARLRGSIEALRAVGARVRGVVLWDAELPKIARGETPVAGSAAVEIPPALTAAERGV